MKFESETLDNGLQVIAEINPDALSSSYGFFVKTGARDETNEISGVSHFLEHMLFKGTNRRSADELNRELDDLGSQANAYTSEEQTVYYASVLPEFQTQTVDILGDMMRPALRDDDFEVERKVIIEEIAMYDDQPPYGAMELITEDYFGDHPLARRVLGTTDSVSELDRQAMRDYHESRYAPNNLALVATGGVDFEALVEQAKRLTADWRPHPLSRYLNQPTVESSSRCLLHAAAAQQYTLALSPGPSRRDDLRYAARLVASILGDEGGSRLFWQLVDTGLAESAALFTQSFEDCGLFGCFLSCAPEAAEKNWNTFREVLRSAISEPITEDELTRARNKAISNIVIAAERPSNRLFTVGNTWTLRECYETVADVVAKYESVQQSDLQDVLNQWLDEPLTIISIGPTLDESFTKSIATATL